MATHCSILTWRIPMDRGSWQTTVCGVTKSQESDMTERLAQHMHVWVQGIYGKSLYLALSFAKNFKLF